MEGIAGDGQGTAGEEKRRVVVRVAAAEDVLREMNAFIGSLP